MVGLDSKNKTTNFSNKINILKKNIKNLMFSINKLMGKLDKPVEKIPKKEKERVSKILDNRNVNKPRDNYNSKRE